MVSHIASAIRFVERHPAPAQQGVVGKDVRALRVAPECQHWRVLEQQQRIADPPVIPQVNQMLL